nr:MAG TPA: hypothetical protein [Caudoviricetes sp.]
MKTKDTYVDLLLHILKSSCRKYGVAFFMQFFSQVCMGRKE